MQDRSVVLTRGDNMPVRKDALHPSAVAMNASRSCRSAGDDRMHGNAMQRARPFI
jgi:hypothetical protein